MAVSPDSAMLHPGYITAILYHLTYMMVIYIYDRLDEDHRL